MLAPSLLLGGTVLFEVALMDRIVTICWDELPLNRHCEIEKLLRSQSTMRYLMVVSLMVRM